MSFFSGPHTCVYAWGLYRYHFGPFCPVGRYAVITQPLVNRRADRCQYRARAPCALLFLVAPSPDFICHLHVSSQHCAVGMDVKDAGRIPRFKDGVSAPV